MSRPRVASLVRLLAPLGLGAALGLAALSARADGEAHGPAEAVSFSEVVPGAATLEGRIRAPCCWNQTLDVHSSPITNQLRREIRTRLKAGEAPDVIEASLVQRYGERVLAVPRTSPVQGLAVGLLVGLLGAAGGLLMMVRRWKRASTLGAPAGGAPALSQAEEATLDARIDRELERLR